MKDNETYIVLKPLGTEEPQRLAILLELGKIADITGITRIRPTREQWLDIYKADALNPGGIPKPYLEPMINYFEGREIEIVTLTSDRPVEELVKMVDEAVGWWDPNESNPGEIRHIMVELGLRFIPNQDYDNLIHSPSTLEDMRREYQVWIVENNQQISE